MKPRQHVEVQHITIKRLQKTLMEPIKTEIFWIFFERREIIPNPLKKKEVDIMCLELREWVYVKIFNRPAVGMLIPKVRGLDIVKKHHKKT